MAKRTTKKIAASTTATKKLTAITNTQTKSEILGTIAADTGLTKQQVAKVFSSMSDLLARHINNQGSGEFTIPDTGVKIRRTMKPARKERMGRNPATGKQMKIAAKPACNTVKVIPLKALKDVAYM